MLARLAPTLLVLLFAALPGPAPYAQSRAAELAGAWSSSYDPGDGSTVNLLLIVADGHFAMTSYSDQEFLATLGGSYRADGKTFSVTYDFDTSAPENVGTRAAMPYTLTGNLLLFNGTKAWTRVDDGRGSPLAGAWLISGRKRDGEMRRNFQTGPRKTMKILSGGRFQWIAYNEDSGEFFGTGGGRYSTKTSGTYIEKIDFFSRDNARVGDQLSFDYKIRNGEWHHSGVSSKGEPLYETWARRK